MNDPVFAGQPYAAFVKSATEFIFRENIPRRSDVIWVPGSRSTTNALHAASLYREGLAGKIVVSGRYAKELGHFAGAKGPGAEQYAGPYETECDFLCAVLKNQGVPEDALLREDQATYTWQNAQFSRALTDAAAIMVRRAILCCKPFHARRALTYYQAAYPKTEILVCPCPYPGCEKEDWYRTERGRRLVLGEIQRCGSQLDEVLTMMIGGGDTDGAAKEDD